MLPNVVTVNVTGLEPLVLLLLLPLLPDEHPVAMSAKEAAPATAATTLLRESFTVTPSCMRGQHVQR
jgi:hypothetical protein